MENNKNRYKEMEKYMTLVLIGAAILFVIFLIAAGCGIIWLKILTAIIAILVCGLCLAYLYMTRLLTAPRSLWMSAAAGSIIICTLFSWILGFPSPL
jgi:hypothetical protein